MRNRQRAERAQVVSQIDSSNKRILDLKKQKIDLQTTQRKIETEIGPIKYFAQFVYNTDDTETIGKAVRLLIVILVFVFDPLAILLVVAANIQYREQSKKQREEPKEQIEETQQTSQKSIWKPEKVTEYETQIYQQPKESKTNFSTHDDDFLLSDKELEEI